MKILHHDDLDGRCAAAIALMKYLDAECIEMSYSTPVPFDRIQLDEEVIIVDFSLQVSGDWERLYELTQDIVWIDHHETAINQQHATFDTTRLEGLRRIDRCGAWLAWVYYHAMDEPPPMVIGLIDRWDRWVHNDDREVLDFVNGSEIFDFSAMSATWGVLFRDDSLSERTIREIQFAGEIIGQFRAMEDAKAVKRLAFPVEWEGYNCIVLHTDRAGSKIFDSVKGQYDILIPVNFDGRQYTVHLYSDTVKVNDIAVKYGGGGHPGAAGFVCEKLPWREG